MIAVFGVSLAEPQQSQQAQQSKYVPDEVLVGSFASHPAHCFGPEIAAPRWLGGGRADRRSDQKKCQ